VGAIIKIEQYFYIYESKMAFSPKFLVLGAMLVSLLLAVMLLSAPPAEAGALTGGNGSPGTPGAQSAKAPAANQAQVKSEELGSSTLDLNLLARQDNIGEADNVRWSLVRGTGAAAGLFDAQSGVNWTALRKVSASGTIRLAAEASWSFNKTYGGGVGYKIASGVLAGGQCSLATAFRAAAMKAGLVTKASPHRRPIPGFPQDETVNIWWGSYDLVIENTSGRELSMDWNLTPASVEIVFR
jgi:hypothetical protein